jgi:hypothetical protein
MVAAKALKSIVFWELVFESIRHRPIRTGLSIVLIAVPVMMLLTVIALGQRRVSNSSRLTSGSVAVRSPGNSVRNFGSGPVPQDPFRRAATNPLMVVVVINCFAVTFLSMHAAVLQRKREIGILRSLGASKRSCDRDRSNPGGIAGIRWRHLRPRVKSKPARVANGSGSASIPAGLGMVAIDGWPRILCCCFG